MYCKKLQCIKDHEYSVEYLIDNMVINKLDRFIKEKVTLKERERLSPSKFSTLMHVDQRTAMMTFAAGVKCGMFKAHAQYNCDCGNIQFVDSVKDIIECECGREIDLNLNRDKIYLFFELLTTPEKCCDEDTKIYQVDYLKEESENFSLADMDRAIGKDNVESMLSLKHMRNLTMRKQAEG